MNLKKFVLLFIITLCFFVGPKVFAAENLSGAWTSYNKAAFHSVMSSGYDSTYNMTFPTQTYQQIPAVNYVDGNYTIFTQMQLQPVYNFTSGTYYTLKFRFDFGSYIYPVWPNNNSQSWFFTGCPGSNCTLSYQWQGDSTHQATSYLDLTINFKATSNSSNVLFTIGNTTDNLGTFYNSYNSQQGIRISSATIESSSSSGNNQDIIDNDNQNTQNIINNNNQNTQNIINNQNENTEKEIESEKVCSTRSITINRSNMSNFHDGFLNDNGTITSNSGLFVYTDYYSIIEDGIVNILTSSYGNYAINYCLYDSNGDLTSCSRMPINSSVDINVNATGFIRFSAYVGTSQAQTNTTIRFCKNGNQALSDDINDLNNSLNNSDTSDVEANADANFGDVDIDDRGLQSLLNTIVQFVQDIFSQDCTPLEFTIPFVDEEMSLQCMSTIYTTHVPTFFNLYQIITTGLIAYRVILNLFHKIHQLEDPNYDKVEVINL